MTGMSYPLHMYADNVYRKIQLQFSYSRGQDETFPPTDSNAKIS